MVPLLLLKVESCCTGVMCCDAALIHSLIIMHDAAEHVGATYVVVANLNAAFTAVEPELVASVLDEVLQLEVLINVSTIDV